MKEQLIETKYQLEKQLERVEKAIRFLDENPQIEQMLGAYMALMQRGPIPGIF